MNSASGMPAFAQPRIVLSSTSVMIHHAMNLKLAKLEMPLEKVFERDMRGNFRCARGCRRSVHRCRFSTSAPGLNRADEILEGRE